MYNVVIIGGGIVGLACALKLKEQNPKLKIAVLEKEKELAAHQTGHNSGVIHSGLYYKPGSLKAKNCVDGYNELIHFCDEEEIPYEICGKIVVATRESQLPVLDMLHERGKQNGLKNLKELSTEELREYEPHVNGIKGLHVPQTGIIDYTAVTEKYAEKFQHFGGEVFLDNRVTGVNQKDGYLEVVTPSQSFPTRLVLSCAGLHSDLVAKFTSKEVNYLIIPFRWENFNQEN